MSTDYKTVRAEAQKNANATGCDYGVERNAFGFTSFRLPRRESRCGHELRCEVVSPERIENTEPGHGFAK